MLPTIGFTTYGDGPRRVLVLHDWFCDHSSWDAAVPYLTPEQFTYAFADLRGYGASRHLAGDCSADEAAGDAIALADHLGWPEFSLVGHSMSGLVVQRIGQLVAHRIRRMVAVTPAPPTGLQLDQATVDLFRSLALADDAGRFAVLSRMWGTRLSATWVRYKLRRWRESANPEAVAKYVELWGRTDISQGAAAVTMPMLIVAGTRDAPPFQPAALESTMLPFYPQATIVSIDSGHYPMEEQPPLLATLLERFLGA